MPRPRKRRRVWHEPKPAIFKPVGVPLHQLQTITLLHEELEALRLVDFEGRYQEEAARRMNISRSTLQRMISEARTKVVRALVEGTSLHIEGGTFRVATRFWQCTDCNHVWEIEHGSGKSAPPGCPSCGSHVIHLRQMRRQRTHL
jgi:Predicted DNA-binding proteins